MGVPAAHLERRDARPVVGGEQLAGRRRERLKAFGAEALRALGHVLAENRARHILGTQPVGQGRAEQLVRRVEPAEDLDEFGRRLFEAGRFPRGNGDLAAQEERHGAADGDAEPPIAGRRRQSRERAVEPAVALPGLGAEPALHQILGVEMRAGAIAVAGGVDEEQLA